ncbi:MAG: sigma-54-dependent Fis family transcriptional regulator [Vicinamibacteria bacterium]|jgi:DNA-binding NtrC family response regulator|nr:sigma-54-dependent Fis family transcriptional regulator [Vicinamibacteria bacterium]
MSLPKVLVVDDEEVMRDVLGSVLGGEGYSVRFAATGPDAIAELKEAAVDAVILDLMLPGMSGLEVLDEMKRIDADLPVIMLTAQASIETAISAMKKGAFDYLTKPFKHDELLILLKKALQQTDLVDENRSLKLAIRPQGNFLGLVGKSPRMEQVYALIQQAGPARTTVLINGESGTGKELVAKALHVSSPRSERPFIVVNSGSLPHELLESNLFGHVKGAFTGAFYSKKGLFELADKGTLFFDEIGNVSMETQAKLLRVIQEREFMRLGGTDIVKVDVRIIAATNIDLRRAVADGRFREDLFYRLNVITVDLPPLRTRKEDIPALVQHFVTKYAKDNGRNVRGFTRAALEKVIDFDWPGNVRELENTVERGVVLAASDLIDETELPPQVRSPQATNSPVVSEGASVEAFNLKRAAADFEQRMIVVALEAARGIQKDAARILGVKPTTLNEMLKRHRMIPPRKGRPGGEAEAEDGALVDESDESDERTH